MTEPLFTGPSESATVAGTVATDGRALASTAAPPDPPSRVWAPDCEEPAPAGTAPGVTRKPPRLQRHVFAYTVANAGYSNQVPAASKPAAE